MDARAGVVHQDVDWPSRSSTSPAARRTCSGSVIVRSNRDRGDPESIQLLDDLSSSAGISDEEHDVAAGSCQGCHQSSTDALIGSGHDRHLAGKENASRTDIHISQLLDRPGGARHGGASLGLQTARSGRASSPCATRTAGPVR